ncbi:MAG TPA: hypothetical protein VFB70_03035 [Pyrinomonadaceae bacterium]|jgi:hypothetical protein|nr:hypothetical protein [Pyrinomonadaceae bacterium]
MKLVKNFVFAVLLVSALAFNTYAGDIELPGRNPPPPSPIVNSDESLTTVTGAATQDPGVETSDYLLYEALAALLSLY